MAKNKNRISIQVGLSGYSFKIEDDTQKSLSGWMGPESVFTIKELQSRYDDVDVSVFSPYCTLVPQNFFRYESAREQLNEGAVERMTSCVESGSMMRSVVPEDDSAFSVI